MERESQCAIDGFSVLIVDDDADRLGGMVALLESLGAIVVGVQAVRSALSYAATARFDAFLLAPRIADGLSLLRDLRRFTH